MFNTLPQLGGGGGGRGRGVGTQKNKGGYEAQQGKEQETGVL